MNLRFQFRRYRLPFRAPVRTGHGVWVEREGILVRLEMVGDAAAAVGFGEAAPVPGFGLETVDELAAACAQVGEWISHEQLAEIPVRLPTLRNAVADALRQLREVGEPGRTAAGNAINHLAIAALLPAGRGALESIRAKAEAGFRIFKWKVGVAEVAEELGLLDDLCALLPAGGKLRLDANGAWDRRKAERWLERCVDRPVEYVEQPCYASGGNRIQGTAPWGKTEDLLLGLANDFPVTIALDESVVADGDVERWLGAGWPGIYVVKPALFADLESTLERLFQARAEVVFSSALETAIGARMGLRAAFSMAERVRNRAEEERNKAKSAAGTPARDALPPPRAVGFGVWPLFADRVFDGPPSAPYIRREDLERIDPATVWSALLT